jgi:hypothetical protein
MKKETQLSWKPVIQAGALVPGALRSPTTTTPQHQIEHDGEKYREEDAHPAA